MTNSMTIGDFSRATRLSAKALRFYHQAGLLEPAWIDPVNGYRFYTVDQIADAQVVRHFRSLDMPIDLIREVVAAPGVAVRNELIAGHLARMETQLEQTRSAVASLRGLLTPPEMPLTVVHRSFPATAAYVVRDVIDLADLSSWYIQATAELERAVAVTGKQTTGPRGGIWETSLFLDEHGPAVLFIPISGAADRPSPQGRVQTELLPAVDLAVATHHGSDDTIGQVYGALGEYVAHHALGVDGPIREFYLQEASGAGDNAITEIGWPIFRTGR